MTDAEDVSPELPDDVPGARFERRKRAIGLVAAPVFAQIAGESLRALRVAPDAPLTGQIVPIDPVPESF